MRLIDLSCDFRDSTCFCWVASLSPSYFLYSLNPLSACMRLLFSSLYMEQYSSFQIYLEITSYFFYIYSISSLLI